MIVTNDKEGILVGPGCSIELTEAEARTIYEQLRAHFQPSKKKGKRSSHSAPEVA